MDATNDVGYEICWVKSNGIEIRLLPYFDCLGSGYHLSTSIWHAVLVDRASDGAGARAPPL